MSEIIKKALELTISILTIVYLTLQIIKTWLEIKKLNQEPHHKK